MISFTSIASSSAGNAYVLFDGRSRLLLECGLPWRKIQKRLDFQTSNLSGVLVTHEHLDHARGLKEAMAAGLDAYASAGTFEALGLGGHRRNDIKSLKTFRIGSWGILPFDAVHDAAEPLGFLLGSPEGKALFLTDSAYCKYRFKGLTHIFIECNNSIEIMRRNVADGSLDPALKHRLLCNHMSLERLIVMLKANDLRAVREIHLLHLSDENSDEDMFKREIMRHTGKPVIVAGR